ncbi:alkaline phosphatase family protein [Paraherbaspirillum soli]|uniref:Alkaline phosphatase family protein n=1 Tax=Paraherbaspirillum soli TaxID=631222 RepID=A0ABW0M6Q0_9BURK
MSSLDKINHFVVLMLENKSFDNLLGSPDWKGSKINGLTGAETNPDKTGDFVRVWNSPIGPNDAWLPTPDPGELFTDINEQIGVNSAVPPMSGFVSNYLRQGGVAKNIMHYFTEQQVPALTALARSYAICDEWFASAPCQTWPNRFFVHTGTAGGYENNSPLHFPYLMRTIFNALEGVAPNGWEIYFGDFPHALTLSRLWDHLDHFRPFQDFLDDAKHGHLPSYSFIEPRYFADLDWPNDMHPPHNLNYGDQLVATVYNALRNSPNWESTMLVVTFDEHGGCYDHVLPPKALPPTAPGPGQKFAFDRYGVRVPAVVVSPLIRPGTVLRSTTAHPYDHTSIISTLRKRFGITQSLTDRDAHAPDLEQVLNLDLPSNDARDVVQALPPPASDNAVALNQARLAPLNGMQQSLHAAAAHLVPLIHGVSVANHITTLSNGFAPMIPPAASPTEALPFIRNILGKLLP